MRLRRFRNLGVLALMVSALALAGQLPGVRASFTDRVQGTATVRVGPFASPTSPPAPPECAGMAFAEVLVGTAGDDHIMAGNGGALVFGLGGHDTLDGGNGKDVLLGGEGDDMLHGSGDDDLIDGGNGRDFLDGAAGIDACYGTPKDLFQECETGSQGG